MNRITIKNVHFSEALSEETNAFTADVYLDGKKFGYAKNNGQGGCTNINRYPDKMEELKEAEAYANGLGEVDYGDFKMKASLDAVVDKLFSDHIEAKELKKAMKKGLVYKAEDGSTELIQWNVPMSKVLEHSKGEAMLKAKILEIRSKGGKILNTNIPEELLK